MVFFYGTPIIFLYISSSWVELRLHNENQLPRLSGSGLKVCGGVGGVGYTPIAFHKREGGVSYGRKNWQNCVLIELFRPLSILPGNNPEIVSSILLSLKSTFLHPTLVIPDSTKNKTEWQLFKSL